MAERKAAARTGGRLRQADAQAMEHAQASQAGTEFQWHYGRLTRLGTFDVAGEDTRAVTILWEEGASSRNRAPSRTPNGRFSPSPL